MKLKHIIITFLIFLLLIIGIGIKKKLFVPKVEDIEYTKLDINLDLDKVFYIEIKKYENSLLSLEREDNTWFINNYFHAPGRKKKIETLLKTLKELKGELRSSSEEVLGDYGIKDEEAIELLLKDKDKKDILKLFVGTKRPQSGSCFVRLDKKNVFFVDRDILYLMNIYSPEIENPLVVLNWVDLHFFSPPHIDEVTSLQISRKINGKNIIIAKVEKKFDEKNKKYHWIGEKRLSLFPLDASKIKSFLKKISNLLADDIIDSKKEKEVLNNPLLRFELKGKNTSPTIIVGEKKDNYYYAKTAGYLYKLSPYVFEKLAADMSKFFVDDPLEVEKIEEIEIQVEDKNIKLDRDKLNNQKELTDNLKKFALKKFIFDNSYEELLKKKFSYSIFLKKKDTKPMVIYIYEKDGKFIGKIKNSIYPFEIEDTPFRKIIESAKKIQI